MTLRLERVPISLKKYSDWVMEMDNSKVYVNVIANFSNDGRILPFSITWEDGREFKIDQVVDIRPAAAMKAGGQGDRYTVRVQGRDKYLFFERNASIGGNTIGRWFVEHSNSN